MWSHRREEEKSRIEGHCAREYALALRLGRWDLGHDFEVKGMNRLCMERWVAIPAMKEMEKTKISRREITVSGVAADRRSSREDRSEEYLGRKLSLRS